MFGDDFDTKFAQLVEMAKIDPEAFEDYRKDLLDKEIIRISEGDPKKEERLRGVQWRLEQDLSKYKDPVARYNAMVTIFYKQVEEFQKSLAMQTVLEEAHQNANILTFPKKK